MPETKKETKTMFTKEKNYNGVKESYEQILSMYRLSLRKKSKTASVSALAELIRKERENAKVKK